MYAVVCGTNEMRWDGMAAHNLLMEMETFLSVCFPFFSHLGRENNIQNTNRAEEKVGHLLLAGASYTYIIYSF